MSLKNAILIVLLVLVIDQVSKIYMKTSFQLNDGIEVLNGCSPEDGQSCQPLFELRLVENPGMAWGVEIPKWLGGKLALTIFRIFAILGIAYWLWDAARKHAPKVLMIAVALIFAGAFGNIIDSIFYGVIFDDSYAQVAKIFPEQGYGKLFHGKVVDMFSFSFFNPVFNVADFAISVGVGILIVFNKKAFPKKQTVSEGEVEEMSEIDLID
ncbi:MAG: lipoprotein signal peptidase [Bacteroidota bacterium]